MELVTAALLEQVTSEALLSPRLRKNHNIHRCDESRCHRLLNAVEPGSYIRPHRHLDPEKDEAFILLKGRLGIVTFTDDGTVAETVLLSRAAGTLAVDIPWGIYHTAISLQSGTVFYETKAGPYLPLAEAEKAHWSPEDGDLRSMEYLESLRVLFD